MSEPLVDEKLAQWLKRLAQAGFEDGPAGAALAEVANAPDDDNPLKEQYLRIVAQQAASWYRQTVEGKPLTPDVLRKYSG